MIPMAASSTESPSGFAIFSSIARRAASALRNEGGNVVALLPDHGSRYTDTQFDVEWLSARDIFVPSLYDSKDEGK